MMMTDTNEEKIRERAYFIWEREGRPEGREAEHWHAAVLELTVETNGTNGTITKHVVSKAAPKLATAEKPSRKSRIKSIVAKAKDALDGESAAPKPAEPKRKRSAKADSDPSKRSPQAP